MRKHAFCTDVDHILILNQLQLLSLKSRLKIYTSIAIYTLLVRPYVICRIPFARRLRMLYVIPFHMAWMVGDTTQ